jgi:hypothetical protein
VIHGVVMDAHAIRMGMIATDPINAATHCHAADVNASAEAAHVRTAINSAEMSAADVRASTKSTHVAATAETSAVTATTTSAAAPCIGRADC